MKYYRGTTIKFNKNYKKSNFYFFKKRINYLFKEIFYKVSLNKKILINIIFFAIIIGLSIILVIYAIKLSANDFFDYNKLSYNRINPLFENNNILTTSEIKETFYSAGGEEEIVVPVSFKTYTVKKNDTLWEISKKFRISMDSIYSCNNLKSPHVLKPGIKLLIPSQTGIMVNVSSINDIKKYKATYGIDDLSLLIANKVSSIKDLIKKKKIFLPNVELPFTKKLETYGIKFALPVYGYVTSGYGYRKDPFTGKRRFHSGLDIANLLGTRIRSAFSGRVIYAGRKGGYGLMVIIKHPLGYETYYGHLSKIYVKKGQTVGQGQVIGLMGSTGRSTGPHLHFEIRKFGKTLNPAYYIKGLPRRR